MAVVDGSCAFVVPSRRMRIRWSWLLLAGMFVDCTCRDSSETDGDDDPVPVQPTPNPTPNPTPVPTPNPTPVVVPTPTPAVINERVRAWLQQQSLEGQSDRYRVFDVNGDGLADVVHDHGFALQTASGMDDKSPPMNNEITRFSGPVATPRGVLLAFGSMGHEVDSEGRQPRSDTWMDWTVYTWRGDGLVDVMPERFNEDGPFGLANSVTLAPLADGSVLETVGSYSRALTWTDASLRPATCWREQAWSAASAPIAGCTGRSAASVHLREVDRLDRSEDDYTPPAGQPFAVIAAGSTRRGAARLYCVTDGSHEPAWMFLTPQELTGCPSFD